MINKVDLLVMVDMKYMVDNMDMVNNMNMVDSNDKFHMLEKMEQVGTRCNVTRLTPIVPYWPHIWSGWIPIGLN